MVRLDQLSGKIYASVPEGADVLIAAYNVDNEDDRGTCQLRIR